MVSSKILALVGLVASPVLATTPQGYGYGDSTDTIVGASTYSPASTDLQPYNPGSTITDSVTVTKPYTVTHTLTLTVPACGSGKTTTIDGTTSVTVTTKNTIFISIPPLSQLSTETADISPTGSASIAGSSITPVSWISSLATGSTTTSCDSTITTGDVDGATGSSSSNPSSTFLLSFTSTRETASVGASGTHHSTDGIAATHTSSSTVPYSSVTTSMGVPMVDSRFLMGAMSLVALVFTILL
ncbi:hypothetical protein F5Y14DRAFT_462644 [Nemania sp. NC0429]|nr:hypothetical protein F5Y14DRAFT_462644 [Nemania sp. NC0429]